MLYNIYQNTRYQVIVGETFGNYNENESLIISIRERYSMYLEFPTVPDYGFINNIEPSDISTQIDNAGKNLNIYTYKLSTEAKKYEEVLIEFDFEIIEKRFRVKDGYMTVYSKDEYYVIVGDFPTFTSITVGYN